MEKTLRLNHSMRRIPLFCTVLFGSLWIWGYFWPGTVTGLNWFSALEIITFITGFTLHSLFSRIIITDKTISFCSVFGKNTVYIPAIKEVKFHFGKIASIEFFLTTEKLIFDVTDYDTNALRKVIIEAISEYKSTRIIERSIFYYKIEPLE